MPRALTLDSDMVDIVRLAKKRSSCKCLIRGASV